LGRASFCCMSSMSTPPVKDGDRCSAGGLRDVSQPLPLVSLSSCSRPSLTSPSLLLPHFSLSPPSLLPRGLRDISQRFRVPTRGVKKARARDGVEEARAHRCRAHQTCESLAIASDGGVMAITQTTRRFQPVRRGNKVYPFTPAHKGHQNRWESPHPLHFPLYA
jgi:hypothetical protein